MSQNKQKSGTRMIAGVVALASVITFAGEVSARSRVSRPTSNGPTLPEIRISVDNKINVCATSTRLMAFIATRNTQLEPKFRTIAAEYKRHGDALGVRWDWAFFQMVLETNYLQFRRGDGKPGDVRSSQNNFAGIGATGGGVPGERFSDVTTGVKAHIEHLIAYSGETVESPVSKRTGEVQDIIIKQSRKLGRAVRFDDLTRRWAADRNYARSMEAVARRFDDDFCKGKPVEPEPVAALVPPKPVAAKWATAVKPAIPKAAEPTTVAPAVAQQTVTRPAGVEPTGGKQNVTRQAAAQASDCQVMTASFGGAMIMLIRQDKPGQVVYTALEVEKGAEDAQTRHYISQRAAGGVVAGRFMSRDAAVDHAYDRCDSGKH